MIEPGAYVSVVYPERKQQLWILASKPVIASRDGDCTQFAYFYEYPTSVEREVMVTTMNDAAFFQNWRKRD